ncbi:MAG: hypothetical protein EBR82_59005, partial [Caulobacteraceae bacterium]|nr:hypothetical protein [Caulobacteraceae bacterium]
MEVIEVIEKEIEVIEVIERGPQGPPGASQADVLTTQGDLLYRGASAAARLAIGTAGQILKVNAGATAPEWGAPPASGVTSVAGRTGDVTLAKSDVGLGNVDNTSDANKPISTATQTALDGKAASSHTHTANQITDFDSAAQTATALQYDGGYPYAAGLWDYSQNLIGSDVQDKRLRIYNGAFSTAAIDASGVSGYKEFDLPNASGTLALTTTPPASHTHGSITNDGKIGTTANLPLITTTEGAVATGSFGTSANTFCQGNDSRLSDARTPTAHTHAAADVTSGTFDNARVNFAAPAN